MRHVFVYGTLRSGEINDIACAAARHRIDAPHWIGSATVSGRLYDFGAYPGLVPDAGGPVRGEVYAIDDTLVPVLDEIEEIYPGVDSLFQSSEVIVALGGGEVLCLLYVVAGDSVQGLPRIESGDWVLHRLARDVEPAID
ncbi:MAG TPA: gamma-glutamylcyclotransferase family protein [Trinickia sp.]|jgi:gamma-glutamylcyclotransferase (GGCT)/AIG2-like uncharacterized protein YtfP|uniref:gamma-glutamylcyclotransferase family protein n=1 Tax=Trinickia sp. TaxID=2571163 RepID=UPI002C18E8B8|nr:gamma-glutamylcyclotransferase family protein [Trinickia sp.]HTI16747.1 gamma-glutamylcyclotransferase family protein [Trinickia sp.]